MVSLKSPDKYSLLIAVILSHPSALHTPNPTGYRTVPASSLNLHILANIQ
jgi:hypothetical protein